MVSGEVPTRIILFEVGSERYAFPIADVLEVLENREPAGIPTLSPEIGGVINHHGETLPVIGTGALFDDADPDARAEHLLVLGGDASDAGQLGVPVGRVLGLADAPLEAGPAPDFVRCRVTIEGRVVAVLDAARCLARAEARFSESATHPRRVYEAPPTGLDNLIQELSTGGESL